MYYFVMTRVELYRKLNFQKENINKMGLDDNNFIIFYVSVMALLWLYSLKKNEYDNENRNYF